MLFRSLIWFATELANRQSASLAVALRGVVEAMALNQLDALHDIEPAISHGLKVIAALQESEAAPYAPLTPIVATEGDVVRHLLELPFDTLLHPMDVSYIHFLHHLTMMGTLSPRKCGRFRTVAVHVGDPGIVFPPASVVPEMMAEYCRGFPTILPTTVKYDPIMQAAEASYRFARIHPYVDGNGRVSRLLMNLVLWGHHPPVALKANKKGRHRYQQALRRANRGNMKPLACLIAMSLVEVYDALLAALGREIGRASCRGRV